MSFTSRLFCGALAVAALMVFQGSAYAQGPGIIDGGGVFDGGGIFDAHPNLGIIDGGGIVDGGGVFDLYDKGTYGQFNGYDSVYSTNYTAPASSATYGTTSYGASACCCEVAAPRRGLFRRLWRR